MKVLLSLALLVSGANLSFGSLIVNTANPIDMQGAGLGAVNTIITLQSLRDATIEAGCVAPSGAGVTTTGCGFANSQVQAQFSSPTLAALGYDPGDLIQLIFNTSEPPPQSSVTIDQLSLTLYGPGGTTNVHTLPSPVSIGSTVPGIGNAGFLITLTDPEAAAAASFIATSGGAANVRLGLGAQISDAQGGLDTFFARTIPGGVSDVDIPEPTSILLLSSGLIALGLARRRQRT